LQQSVSVTINLSMTTLRRKWNQFQRKCSSPDCCLAGCETMYFVRWLHNVTSRMIAVKTSDLAARPQHLQLSIHISVTVGLRLPARLTDRLGTHLFVCCLALKANVPTVSTITEPPAAVISLLMTFKNSMKRSNLAQTAVLQLLLKYCTLPEEDECSPHYHILF
jgi:hypothetical protein